MATVTLLLLQVAGGLMVSLHQHLFHHHDSLEVVQVVVEILFCQTQSFCVV